MKTDVLLAASELGISMKSEFIPLSEEKLPSLNWKISLYKNSKVFIETDYMAGMAHCPSYKNTLRLSLYDYENIRHECETGKTKFGKNILPDFADVLSSLISECDTINYPTYEDWAENFGYDKDSRKGESIYRQCLEIALKFRSAIGESGVEKLRTAYEK